MKIGEWVARLGEVWVEGQITQVSQGRGNRTAFLVLRDPSADISINVTCSPTVLNGLSLVDGTRIIARARPDYYAARGSLSLRASEIRPVGIGELLARLERLKKILQTEGLFAPARKKPLPFLPQLVGLVTGRNSAAERDVVENARRRWPAVEFRCENVAVQGTTAASQVIRALAALDEDPHVDVIVIARGGGSVEDLLPFSDEALCRAVALCRTPVVSAIGHEPDSPLLDLVADVRASTPTDAGKRIVPDVAEEQARITQLHQRAFHFIKTRLDRESDWLAAVRSRPILAAPQQLIDGREHEAVVLVDRARRSIDHWIARAEGELTHTRARVAALSPAATLQRGYAIVQTNAGHIIRQHDEVSSGESLHVRLAEGGLTVTVQETQPA